VECNQLAEGDELKKTLKGTEEEVDPTGNSSVHRESGEEINEERKLLKRGG